MISFRDPDTRRALRAIIEALVVLALLGLLYWVTYLLESNAAGLTSIARGALIIIGLGTLFYGAENVSRAIKLTGPLGWGAELGEEAKAAVVAAVADKVASAAVDQAQALKEDAKP